MRVELLTTEFIPTQRIKPRKTYDGFCKIDRALKMPVFDHFLDLYWGATVGRRIGVRR